MVANSGINQQQYANIMGRADLDGNGSIKKIDELKPAMIAEGLSSAQRKEMYKAFGWKDIE